MSGETDWHLDKRLPVTIIIALLLQTGGAVWWAASIDAQQRAIEQRVTRVEIVAANSWMDRYSGSEADRDKASLAERRRVSKAETVTNLREHVAAPYHGQVGIQLGQLVVEMRGIAERLAGIEKRLGIQEQRK